MITPNDAINSLQLVNRTEVSRMTSNHSDVNRNYLSDGYAVLGSAEPPINLDLQATSSCSKTSCRVVIGLCGAVSTVGAREPYPALLNFVCNASTAGLNMTVSLFNVLAPLNNSGFTTGPPVTNIKFRQWWSHHSLGGCLGGGNTIAGKDFAIGAQYFSDLQKQEQTVEQDAYYGLSQDPHQLYWASVWRAPFSSPLDPNRTQPVTNDTAAVRVSDALPEGSLSVLSCETNISKFVSYLRTLQ